MTAKNQLKKVRVQLWNSYIKCQTGCENPYQIERYLFEGTFPFHQGENNETVRPHVWEPYEQGLHVPQHARRQFVEDRVAGSRYWLELSFWKLLDTTFQPTQQYLMDIINRGSKQLGKHLQDDKHYSPKHLDLLWMRARVNDLESVLAVLRYCEQELEHERSHRKIKMLSEAVSESKFSLVTMLFFLASREKHVDMVLEELLDYVYRFFIKGSLPEISNTINIVAVLKCLSEQLTELKKCFGGKFRLNDYYFYFWLFGSLEFKSYFWLFNLNAQHLMPETIAKSVIDLLLKYLPILEKKKHIRAFQLTKGYRNIELFDLLGYEFDNLTYRLQ